MIQIKQLLENNAIFRKIFLEESKRACRILREYNEAEIWSKMPESLRKIALQTAGDVPTGMNGEYELEDDWLQIPDIITSRINISDFDIPKNISANKLIAYIESNRNKLPKTAWYQGSVGNPKTTYEVIEYLNSGRANEWTLKNIIGYLKLEGDFPDINYAELVSAPASNSISVISNTGTEPSRNRDWRGGSYTGD